ncbi:uncharacterized protein [Diabrotica undecimpunctata]|uniref:uncharacterized protein isoform X1 n=1 Tax=Diabrotica undecimpunctata TaxID=50387 RepID=UPI003B63C93B
MAMSTRRKRILSLVNISNETNLLFLPKYETTHGTSVTEQQIAIADKNGTDETCQKQLARVTCHSTVMNLNSSLNYPSTYHYSIRNRTNKNNRDLVPEEEDGTDYSPDPFEDSGSAYSPSSDGSNFSLEVSKENETSPITDDHNKEDTPLTKHIVAQNKKDDVELCSVSVAKTRKERENNEKTNSR